MVMVKWFWWRCPKRGCPRKIGSTVERYTETNVLRHLQMHTRQKERKVSLAKQILQVTKEIS